MNLLLKKTSKPVGFGQPKKKLSTSLLYLLLLTTVCLWGYAYLAHGMWRVYSWLGVIIALPVVGVCLGLGLGVGAFIHKKVTKRGLLALVLALVMIFPISVTFGLVPLGYPVDPNLQPALVVPSPFKSPVHGIAPDLNPAHRIWPQERYAYDFVATPYDTGSKVLTDYGIYDMLVYSPVKGTVIATFNSDPDITPNTEDFKSMAGNYVYIRIEKTGTYLMLVHLKQDSLVVKAGDTVNPGDLLGAIGNSGTTSEPHLHIQHQRQDPRGTMSVLFAEGLPLTFKEH